MADYKGLTFEQGCFGSRFPRYRSPLGRAAVAPKSPNAVKPEAYVLVTWFGKAHYVSPRLYERDADIYNMLHWKEALILLDQIHSLESIYREWSDPSGFMESVVQDSIYLHAAIVDGAKSMKYVRTWFNEVKRAPKPDVGRYHALAMRAIEVLDHVSKSDLKVEVVVANGLDLERIREDLKALEGEVRKFRERAISSAEGITHGLESVESVSFQILNIVPTITFMDPIREAIYKISVLMVRTSARGVGGALAYGTRDAFVREALGVLKREAPGVIVDVILAPVNKFTRTLGWSQVGRDALSISLQQVLEFTAGLTSTIIENKGKALTDAQWEKLLVERLASLVGTLVSRLFHVRLEDKNSRVLLKSACESLAKTLVTEIHVIYKACETEERDVGEVVLAELPTMIMRIVEGTIVGFAQRKASQAAEYSQTQRLTEQTDFREAAVILDRTNVSTLWNGRVDRGGLMEVRAGRARAIPFTDWEYRLAQFRAATEDLSWRSTNLEYETAAGVRRYADEARVLCFYHRPNKSRLNHTETDESRGAKWGKPMSVPAKSADGAGLSPDLAGLVVKPRDGPPGKKTHEDVAGAQKTWDESAETMARNGMVVREDGVVFHPDQLLTWAKLKPSARPAVERAEPLLHALQKAGVWDLSPDAPPEQRQRLEKFVRDRAALLTGADPPEAKEARVRAMLADMLETVGAAKVGFYSDLDPVDFVDAESGNSLHFGNKPKEALDIAAENRRLINEYVSKDLAGRNEGRDPRQSQAPGTGGGPDKRQEHPESEIQHGASMQMEGRGVAVKDQKVMVKDGAFAVAPGGELVFFFNKVDPAKLAGLSPKDRAAAIHEDIMKQWDEYVRFKVGDRKFQDQARRVDKIRKDDRPLNIKVKKSTGKPPPITREDLEIVHGFYDGIEVLDGDGLGPEIDELAVLNSLHVRGLDLDPHAIVRAIEVRGYPERGIPGTASPWQFEAARKRIGSSVGFHRRAAAIVIATRHYRATLGHALAELVETRRAIGSIGRTDDGREVKIWFEIYTAYRPMATAWLRDRIGPPETGVTKAFAHLGEQCPTFAMKEGTEIVGFTVKGVTPAFTPPAAGVGEFEGLWLHELVEDKKTRRIDERPVVILEGGVRRNIAVFTSPVDDGACLVTPITGSASSGPG